jgi:hypothetical protein
MRYIATMNTPGYLPQSDDAPPVFDTPAAAWEYLASERRTAEDADETEYEDDEGEYSDVVDELDTYENADHGPDTVHGYTPGRAGDRDLGIAYSVTQVERVSGRCPCCGDDVAVMDAGYCCDDCDTEGCEEREDAGGEVAYWECQRTDSLADAEESGS